MKVEVKVTLLCPRADRLAVESELSSVDSDTSRMEQWVESETSLGRQRVKPPAFSIVTVSYFPL